MRVIIAGVGDIGLELAERLSSSSDNELVLIDTDPKRCDELTRELDAKVLNQDGADPEVLTDAGARESDVLVVSTGSDPTNLLIGLLGKKFSVPHLLVKLNDQSLEDTCQELGIDGVVLPDLLGVQEIENKLNSWIGDEEFEL